MTKLNIYPDTTRLFDSTAAICRNALERALEKGKTKLVVSGGTTPRPLFERLSKMPLNWSDVTIMPSDDRWVDANHSASNELLIRTYLLQSEAASARYLGLKTAHETPFDAEQTLNQTLVSENLSAAISVVGMGPDGHFASLFPSTEQVQSALDLKKDHWVSAIDATGCPVAGDYTQRMSLTLSAILNSDRIVLLFTGNEKLALVRQILNDAKPDIDLPVSYLLLQERTPVDICCC